MRPGRLHEQVRRALELLRALFERRAQGRLQRFDPEGRPSGQWAYRADPRPGGPIGGLERAGVVDLLSLPGGELLVLERTFSDRGFRARIHQVDLRNATDVSDLSTLAGADFEPARKRLLWEGHQLAMNFEGWTRGGSPGWG